MKRKLKKAMSILLAFTLLFGSFAFGFSDVNFANFAVKAEAATSGTCGENLTWVFDTNTGTLTISGTGAMDDYSHTYGIMPPWCDYNESVYFVSLPDGLTNISDHAFQNTKITSITIPNGVTKIGYMSFYSCESLESVTISDTVTKFGYYCFEDCKNLKNIKIPASVTSIGTDSFRGCDSIAYFEVDSANQYYSNDNYGVLFNKSKTRLEKYPAGNTKNTYEIPDGVKYIDSNAFEDCIYLTRIDIPYGVTTIYNDVFYGCIGLENIIIPESVTKIYTQAIQKCTNLEYVHIPASVTSIGSNFAGTPAYICSDTEGCFAKEYADENGIEFRICEGHDKIEDEPTTVHEETTVPSTTEPTTIPNVTEPSTMKPVEESTTIPTTTEPSTVPSTAEPTTKPTETTTTKPEVTKPATTKPATTKPSSFKDNIIKTPSTSKINYGDTLILHADFTNIPADAKIEWSVEGEGVTIKPSADGKTCAVTSTATGDVTITAKYVDANGVEHISKQEIKSNASFWQKIISFFKNLFGIDRIIEQRIKFN